MRQLGLLTALVACLCCSVFPRRKRNRRELASTIKHGDTIERGWRRDKISTKWIILSKCLSIHQQLFVAQMVKMLLCEIRSGSL